MTFTKEINAIGLVPEKLEARARKRVSPLRMNKIKHGPAPKSFLRVSQGAEPSQAGGRRWILGSSCVRHSPMGHLLLQLRVGAGKWGTGTARHGMWAQPHTALPCQTLHSVFYDIWENITGKKCSVWPSLFFNALNFMQVGIRLLLAYKNRVLSPLKHLVFFQQEKSFVFYERHRTLLGEMGNPSH